MGLFSRGRPGAPPPEAASSPELALLKQRFAETAEHPLKRVTATDLTGEALEVAEALNARLDAVASAEKEQQQFIADVSHELRTPLTVMRGSLEVVLEGARRERAPGAAPLDAPLPEPPLPRARAGGPRDSLFRERGPREVHLGGHAGPAPRDVRQGARVVRGASRGAHARLHRLRPHAAGPPQPPRERDPLHRAGREGPRAPHLLALGGADRGLRHRHRHPGGKPALRLRTLLPERPRPPRASRRLRPRPLDRPLDRGSP